MLRFMIRTPDQRSGLVKSKLVSSMGLPGFPGNLKLLIILVSGTNLPERKLTGLVSDSIVNLR